MHTLLCINSSVLPIFLPANVDVQVKYSFYVCFAVEQRHPPESHYCKSMCSSNRQAIDVLVRQISGINNSN
jgi:hypothetical protein